MTDEQMALRAAMRAGTRAAEDALSKVKIGLLVLLIALMGAVAWAGHGLDQVANAAPADDLRSVLRGSRFPVQLRLKDLNGDWRRFALGAKMPLKTDLVNNVYYTRGETVKIGGSTYLVAYQAPTPTVENGLVAAFSAIGGSSMKLTPDTPLALNLLDLKSAGALADITPFNLQQEIAQSNSASK